MPRDKRARFGCLEDSPLSQSAKLALLAIAWIAWCALHSGLIAPRVTSWASTRWGRWFAFYRLFFNVVSLAAIVPVGLYEASLRGDPLWAWGGPLRVAQVLVWVTCIALFYLGGRAYDFWEFLGLRQIANARADPDEIKPRRLVTKGVFGLVRHPWYAAVMMLIWSHDQDAASLVRNAVLTPYIVIGALLEERKLVAEFGDQYCQYQQQASLLFPWKWLKKKLTGG